MNSLVVKVGRRQVAEFRPYWGQTMETMKPKMMTRQEVLKMFPSMPKASLRTYYIHRLEGGAFHVSQRMDADALVGRIRAHNKPEAVQNAREAGYAVE